MAKLPGCEKEPQYILAESPQAKATRLGPQHPGAKKVYLDTKFWLLFRDVRLGRDVGSDTVALLSVLEAGVTNGKVVCPISYATYFEFFRQTDLLTLRASAQLIDDLSRGIAIIELRERIALEVLLFLLRRTKGPDAVHAMEELIWTKLLYVLGFNMPVLESLPPTVQLEVQKAWLDHSWSITITDMVDVIGNDTEEFAKAFPDISNALNRGKVEHHHENKSFKQLFLSELWGMLDLCSPLFADVMAYMYEKESGQSAPTGETERQKCGLEVANLIYAAFHNNELTREWPSIWLVAGFHAAVRWDRNRKFKANDRHDFHHAVAAIPYCDSS